MKPDAAQKEGKSAQRRAKSGQKEDELQPFRAGVGGIKKGYEPDQGDSGRRGVPIYRRQKRRDKKTAEEEPEGGPGGKITDKGKDQAGGKAAD